MSWRIGYSIGVIAIAIGFGFFGHESEITRISSERERERERERDEVLLEMKYYYIREIQFYFCEIIGL